MSSKSWVDGGSIIAAVLVETDTGKFIDILACFNSLIDFWAYAKEAKKNTPEGMTIISRSSSLWKAG